ncbi:histidine-binding periplasmic domain protein [Escherichia coli 2719100]|uniref:HisJ2 protein n=1 Tax=Escherichia coli TaxID=562 RepID=A0A7I8Z5N6_ECOLX|nr:histidine-binding periplasmic domain protein [Escherichia coli P0301867.1]EMX86721.1 histidine-binding periplasmic domain protein [Escherichia coli 2719100]ENA39518.1 histidine-binding periplasmic domain protein [Escherichia coli P0301867.4]ENA44926.1 histidine-binding periplasmic domain protein [Escherichia coli P0301867.2]ENA61783.1 histidine-binding periplasmic domain protein [Escherichia coli 178900]ENC91278.1 histidine-binding periplasmic domain protein [Escherichia coli P0301867.11]E
MKKLVLSLSLVLAFSSATAALAAIPQNIRIGTDPTYAPFESKIHKANWLASISIWQRNYANASIRNVRLSKIRWMR